MASDQETSKALLEAAFAQARSNWAVEESIGGFSQAIDRLASILTVALQGASMVDIAAKSDAIDLVNVNARLGKLEVSVAKQGVTLTHIQETLKELPTSAQMATLQAASKTNTKGQAIATNVVVGVIVVIITAIVTGLFK